MIATTLTPYHLLRLKRKEERLALIKERYRKLVLEPKRQIAIEIASELGEESVEETY